MTIVRGFAITTISGLVFGGLGALAGYLMATLAPDYYRVVLRIAPGADLNLVQAAIGLGLTQGAGAGFVIGLVIVLAAAWSRAADS